LPENNLKLAKIYHVDMKSFFLRDINKYLMTKEKNKKDF